MCVFVYVCVCMNVRACVFLHVLIKRRRWKVPESCAFHDAWLRGLSASHRWSIRYPLLSCRSCSSHSPVVEGVCDEKERRASKGVCVKGIWERRRVWRRRRRRKQRGRRRGSRRDSSLSSSPVQMSSSSYLEMPSPYLCVGDWHS